ncbi:MAG TPA: cupin domain-containing protein [Nanoarchaeota archaeon]|nr:cupin domain-containing protein [Nanoarchaeota archaeon]HIH63874.1 cupin domain-containing protein [Nanoarchaeota archaeon]HIJ09773.1 cupin domain-containing protein [Nanoarchaeota archaeon]
MVQKILQTDLDKETLSKIPRIVNKALDNFDFSNVIVIKPWGKEYLSYRGIDTDIWTLHIKKDCGTSMHCHPKKRTSLIVLEGEVISSTLKNEYHLKEGEMVLYEKGVFHSTKAISKKEALIMELESPPEKTDLVRLKDEYGREKKGYEAQEEMCFDLSKHERIFLNGDDKHRKVGKMCISIRKFENYEKFMDYIKHNKKLINILIEGEIVNIEGKKIYLPGELVDFNLIENEKLKILKLIKIMTIQKNIFDHD